MTSLTEDKKCNADQPRVILERAFVHMSALACPWASCNGECLDGASSMAADGTMGHHKTGAQWGARG